MSEPKRNPLTGIAAAILAFAFYGGWAMWVNWEHGLRPAVVALLVQGTASFTTTFVLATLVTFFYRRHCGPGGGQGVRLALPAALSTGLVAIMLVLAHSVAGTPALLATIAPSAIIGFGYCIFCTHDLVRVERARVHQPSS